MRVIKISPCEVFLLHFSWLFFTRWLGLNFGFRARAGPSNHKSGWDHGQMGLKDFSYSLCEEINHSSLFFKDSIQHWFPFLHCNLPITRWEIVMCIFMFLQFGKSTGLLFVFKVHLLPDLSCPFFPIFSFAVPPAHESLSNRLYFFIFIFLSVSPYRSCLSRSCLCRLNLLLPMPAECWSAPIYIQTMDGVESRFTSSFLLSVTLLEPLIPHSHPLFPSPHFIQLPPFRCCIVLLGCWVSLEMSKIQGAPRTANLSECFWTSIVGPRAEPSW